MRVTLGNAFKLRPVPVRSDVSGTLCSFVETTEVLTLVGFWIVSKEVAVGGAVAEIEIHAFLRINANSLESILEYHAGWLYILETNNLDGHLCVSGLRDEHEKRKRCSGQLDQLTQGKSVLRLFLRMPSCAVPEASCAFCTARVSDVPRNAQLR